MPRFGLKEILFVLILVLLVAMIVLKIMVNDLISIIILAANFIIIIIVILILRSQREKMLADLDKELEEKVKEIKMLNKVPVPKKKRIK
jgi:Flp pilus assembly protein TadB